VKLQKNVLGDFLRHGTVPQHGAGDAEHHGLVLLHQSGKSIRGFAGWVPAQGFLAKKLSGSGLHRVRLHLLLMNTHAASQGDAFF
jgi:hypothetical protein